MASTSLLFLILSAPFTVVFSPLVALTNYDSLARECNQVLTARIVKVNRLDAMRCSLDTVSYTTPYKNITTAPMSCADLGICRQVLHMHTNKIPQCTNITLAINRWYGQESCVKIIKTSEDAMWLSDYEECLAWFKKGLIECVMLVFLVFGAAYQAGKN